jgi:hypothetical protein
MVRGAFSESIKQDLSKVSDRNPESIRAEIVSAILCAGNGSKAFRGKVDIVSASSIIFAERIKGLLQQLDISAELIHVRKTAGKQTVTISEKDNMLLSDMIVSFLNEESVDRIASTVHERRAALRGAFLSVGTASEPARAYQVEMHVKSAIFARALTLYLHAENIEPNLLTRNGRTVLYFKEGSQIADFLAMIGAHRSLLYFENVRANKEIRNQVNRAVNCDTANAKRLADAGVRRGELIKALLRSSAAGRIPEELKAAADVLIDNPGLSLQDLGEMMDPPIGKSGMYHRMQKLERIAKD